MVFDFKNLVTSQDALRVVRSFGGFRHRFAEPEFQTSLQANCLNDVNMKLEVNENGVCSAGIPIRYDQPWVLSCLFMHRIVGRGLFEFRSDSHRVPSEVSHSAYKPFWTRHALLQEIVEAENQFRPHTAVQIEDIDWRVTIDRTHVFFDGIDAQVLPEEEKVVIHVRWGS